MSVRWEEWARLEELLAQSMQRKRVNLGRRLQRLQMHDAEEVLVPAGGEAVNPMRRMRKAMDLSGRQWRKFRKSHTFSAEMLDGSGDGSL